MAQGTKDLAQFVFYLGFVGDGFGDFSPQNLAVALSNRR